MDETHNESTPQNMPTVDVSADVQDFHNLHPNKKLGVFALILFVFVISIVIGLMMARRATPGTQPTEQTPSQTTQAQQGQTNLRLVPSADSVAVGGTVTVTVMLENTAVQASDIAVNYDPTMFEASSIVNGDVYKDILKSNIDTAKGQVLVNAAVSVSNPQDLRTGAAFSFTLKALKAGAGKVEFDQELTITAKNGINTLGSVEPVTITVR